MGPPKLKKEVIKENHRKRELYTCTPCLSTTKKKILDGILKQKWRPTLLMFYKPLKKRRMAKKYDN